MLPVGGQDGAHERIEAAVKGETSFQLKVPFLLSIA